MSGRAVVICDVGPRDGLQNEPTILDAETRADLVNRLADADLPRIEAVSAPVTVVAEENGDGAGRSHPDGYLLGGCIAVSRIAISGLAELRLHSGAAQR